MVLESTFEGGDVIPAIPPADSTTAKPRRKIIINTDPGVDDAMAIVMAYQSPEFEVVGLTSTFGNTTTPIATRNCLYLNELTGRTDVPVAEGDYGPLNGEKIRIADFVHGADGLGNINVAEPKSSAIKKSATDFLVETVASQPGKISILELGPLTNIARAIEKDPNFVNNVDEIWVLAGSFFASGNVNPATEANIIGDPEAADIVFTSGAKVVIVGLNVTTQTIMTEDDLAQIRDSKSRYGPFVHDITQFYLNFHIRSDHLRGIYLHDPSCMVALLNPSLFTWKSGAVRVETQGICRGLTILDLGLKNWNGSNPWTGQPLCKVAMGVDAPRVVALVKDILCRP